MGSVCSVGIDVLPQMARIDTDVRVRRNLTRIKQIERIAGCGENPINQMNPL